MEHGAVHRDKVLGPELKGQTHPLSASVSTLITLQPGWEAATDSGVSLVQTESLETLP